MSLKNGLLRERVVVGVLVGACGLIALRHQASFANAMLAQSIVPVPHLKSNSLPLELPHSDVERRCDGDTRCDAACQRRLGAPAEVAQPVLPRRAASEVDPLAAPPCDGVEADIVSQFQNRDESVAFLQLNGQTRAKPRRIGEVLGPYRVLYVGYNYLKASAAVWLKGERGLCQVLVSASRLLPRPSGAEDVKLRPLPPRSKPAAKRTQANWTDRIERVDAGEYRVDRALVLDVLENPRRQLGAVRPLFSKQAGGGLLLQGVDKRSVLYALGLKSGDQLLEVNGHKLGDVESAMVALARLREASALQVKLERDGRTMTLRLQIL